METKEFDQAIYNERYKYGYDWNDYNNLAVKVIQMCNETGAKGKPTIDIGCGVGWFTDMYYFNVSRDITGIDFSEKAILCHARRMYPSITFGIENIYEYDYNKYQVALLTEVLEHVEKDIELLSRLPQGCKVYATIPFESERRDITHVREYTLKGTHDRYGSVLDIERCEKFEQYIIIYGIRK